MPNDKNLRRRTFTPEDGIAITLDDLAEFVAEMMGRYELPGTTPVRCMGVIEFDMADGPRIARITADPAADRARAN
jgi:hypothetical protein